ncbi:MAG: lipoprotein insertase outer membrane protein LolB [Gammaproteobacteria bacterium]|nr:lipoprotein insertase outer membrane protein LolB [Gammaproteobacteria bacterium]
MQFFKLSLRMLRAGALILPVLSFFMISGCSVTQPKPSDDPTSPEDRGKQQNMAAFPDTWTILGRISVVNEHENWYARFNWGQQKEDFQISFMGPLGETELQISQIAENIQLKTPSYERTSDDLEQLLFQETGWKFPVKFLRYWSHGVPNPNMAAQIKYNEQQQISAIDQAGWHIQYPKRMQVDQYWLPKKIIVTEQGVKIKIIITSWRLGESLN